MNKNELIAQVAQKAGMTKKDTAAVVDTALDIITETLAKQESVSLIGFGIFTTSTRKAREGINPSTGKRIQIPSSVVAKFKVGAKLREAVRNG
jgi:DNA-binding protein HU-beta